MAAFGRLWRRAPIWRVCVVTAVAFGALAAMFPPTLPSVRTITGDRPAGDGGTTRFHPTPPPPSPQRDSLSGRLLPDGPSVSGMTVLAGREVPLPAGSWRMVGLARQDGTESTQINTMARIENGRLTGLLEVAAPVVLSGAVGPVGEPPPCAMPAGLANRTLPLRPGDGPLTHACWSAVPIDMKAVAATGERNPAARTLALFGEQHIRVADAMLSINLFVSDEHGWELAQMMIPDNGGTIGRVRTWADRFLPVMRQAFEHGAPPMPLPAAVSRDPGFGST